ncbi:pimeloyl-ACP methyl ester carboxylesterase [Rhodococcus sp. AG1013]|uniref:alpha/beta fold hydrolase n=1 Tax=Rhodococcus sp. AG1013 TaxID=2183996 RepID=UPI000E2B6EA1|nr:alpha/beta hydrolase [Rhodococcus sp. AG1013]RDI25684.1 pimeloyl-ACP methyl ester carboxylesterase [Rhodococcus sp. AG1013]
MTDNSTSIELEDGRRIGYAEFGDPAGKPCLFVHGYASSRWMAGWALPADALARSAVRIIAVDRPHYGLSSPHPDAGFLQWAADGSALAEHLGLRRVSVIGVSMGAGPALALTVQRPDLVSGTTILSGMPPIDAHERWTPASRGDALYWWLARHAPRVLQKLCEFSSSMLARAADGEADTLITRMERALPVPDRQAFRSLLDDDARRVAFVSDTREASRQGGSSTAGDLQQYLRPWGFEPANVRSAVRLWHGIDDPKVPVESARRWADRLPHCEARYVPGGHFAPFLHVEDILREL